MTHQFTNDLIHETSPYLLQHAHNPVDWKPWSDNTLQLAKEENKLIIISVGYSACHWCHVMEHESFEDEKVAEVMNANYISIKVDREERPDIDQVYMDAVQLMTGSGGWPLNIVALPDGRPVWGGTYFKREQWMSALSQISKLFQEQPEQLYNYADQLEKGLKSMNLVTLNKETPDFNLTQIDSIVAEWSQSFDHVNGGLKRAPKFMMPNNYQFLLRYAYQTNDKSLLDFVNLTLTQMAYGGIFDQIGGGFSRYSVDDKWHVPHFEKMLYDNGQLVSLYADAYLLTKKDLYKNVITETLHFIETELTTPEGAFMSALDADSNNTQGHLEEGAYYVWTKEELKTLLSNDFTLFAEYYNVNQYGHWEGNNYVLIRTLDDVEFCKKFDLHQDELDSKKNKWHQALLKARALREHPRLDDKTLTSWNAIMLKAYVDAYRVLRDEKYLDIAKYNANFILQQQLKKDGGLFHNYKNGHSSINGFLEDYALTTDAFISLYENTLDEQWLNYSRDFTNYALDHFYDSQNGMFFFTSNEDPSLVTRNIEYRDNVIPSSNSVMAKNLFKLSHYFDNDYYQKTATTLLNNVQEEMKAYGSGFSNWLDLMLNYTNPFYEVVVVGKNASNKLSEINEFYIPNKLIAGSTSAKESPLLKDRYLDNKTMIYVCVNKTCQLPVTETDKALEMILK
ncbi:thioredoxin domain-containing protein [Mangrovimonas sp. YM274]|uniref:thioredoxin domain-containing protein n=1 Tax=Mangrovimonas sp. YM274 TaxID=3070660 RepID=UPI0027DB045A|nr:thioredoxin domain-containing protein [Mangrovimonas sp. YM274]WMI69420.1 thioredoxin domain-containing protein [Mangrovimonas sp. YM274]